MENLVRNRQDSDPGNGMEITLMKGFTPESLKASRE
jgi:hypothetical protein